VSAPEPVARRAGARERWTGFAGSVLLAAGATGAGVLPDPDPLADAPVLSALRSTPGVVACIVLAALGMVLLVRAWWRLCPSDKRPTAGLMVTTAWWALPLALAPPLASRDVYAYAAQGLVWLRGLDPYTAGPSDLLTDRAGVWSGGGVFDGVPGWLSLWVTSVSPTWQGAPAPYGPLFFFVAGGAARGGEATGGNLFVTLALFRLVAIAGVIALAVLIPRLARACGVDPDVARWLTVANPFLLLHLISGAHNDALMLPLLVAGLLVAARRPEEPRPWWNRALVAVLAAGALIGLAAAIKIVAVVVLPFVALLLAPRLRGTLPIVRAGAGAALAAVAVFAGLSAVAGLDTGWIGALQATAGVSVQWTSIPTGWGLAANWVAHAVGEPHMRPEILVVTRTIGSALTVVLLVVLWFWARHRSAQQATEASTGASPAEAQARTAVASSGWALLCVAVLGAAVHPWYFLWTVVLVAAAGSPQTRSRLATASAVLCFLVMPDGYNLARAVVVPGVLFDLALTGAAIVLVLRWTKGRREGTTMGERRAGASTLHEAPAPPAVPPEPTQATRTGTA
jgi:alpha-1,6-mannosyltransferase